MKKLVFCFGTRPEAIKLAPLILDAKKSGFHPIVCLTGQHKELIEPINKFFGIHADANLEVMAPGQSLHQLTAKIVTGMERVLSDTKPSAIVVQGDTTSALAGALAAFYLKVPIIHVEAGLRTDHMDNPFPEEMNRRLIGRMAKYHFPPTDLARENLIKEGLRENIVVTGNTGIDALRISIDRLQNNNLPAEASHISKAKRIILATVHRRENFENLDDIFGAMLEITQKLADVQIVFPVHLNPVVHKRAKEILKNSASIHLTTPLTYPDMVAMMKMSSLILTDSGGLQEEAPYLKKPVLVLRTSTERQEGVTAGVSRIVGNTKSSIVKNSIEVLTDAKVYETFQRNANPYGDGFASKAIFEYLGSHL